MHLSALLPPHLVHRLAGGAPAAVPCDDRFRAALLFSDISGFTALTERLAARGREGAEEIAGVVNGVLRPAIRHVEERGGSIVGFGGDSLLALFTDDAPVGRARAAAEGIRRGVGIVPTTLGPTQLRISQVIHWGDVHGLHLADGARRHHVVCGPGPAALARQEQDARPGVIGLSAEARRQLRREEPPGAPGRPRRLPRLGGAARAYLAPHFVEGLRWLRGEYRRVVIAFFETRGWDVARVQDHFTALMGALRRCDGTLIGSDATPRGVRWLCAFGAPRAHEDDAERAAGTALELLASGGRHVRGGMHDGTAAAIWLGSRSRCSFETLGDVTNTSARTLTKARWGEVLVTAQLRIRLGRFDTRPRGRHVAKGKSAPLELFAVGRARRPREAPDMTSPLVGRSGELQRLRDAIDAVLSGERRVVTISGEAGMGKSRLRWETSRLAEARGLSVHQGRSRAFGARPYEPIADLLRGLLGLGEESSLAEIERRLGSEADLDDNARHHLAEVLGASLPGSPLEHLDGAAIRRNNAAALAGYLATLCRRQPRLFVLEDLHWADEMTRDALPRIVSALVGHPALLLLVHRPGFVHPGADDAIALAELPLAAAEELVRGLLGKPTPRVVAVVLDKAGGNPFYVEELARYLRDTDALDHGADGTLDLARDVPELPGSLESVVDARLSQLPPGARRLVQVGAVIGRRFRRQLVAAFPELVRGLDASLRTLESRQLIFAESAGEPGERGFIFKHAVTRDVAYAGILVAERREIHARVAGHLERSVAAGRDGEMGLLGHHWEHAGEPGRARPHYLAAARRAARALAYAEAEGHYRAWLRLEESGDPEGARVRSELGEKVLSVVGRRHEARALYDEAERVARSARMWDVCATALRGIAVIELAAGRLDEAERTFREALRVLPAGEFASTRALVENSMGALHVQRGQHREAQRAFRSALAVYRASGERQRAAMVLSNMGVLAVSTARVARSERLYREALQLFRAEGDRAGASRVLGNLASISMARGRIDESERLFRQALEIIAAIGNRPSEGVILGHLALVERQHLRIGDSIATLRRALDIARDVGDRYREAVCLSSIGSMENVAGRHGASRASHRAAVAIATEIGAMKDVRYLAGWAQLEYAEGRTKVVGRLVARGRELPGGGAACLLDQLAGHLAEDRGDLREAARCFRAAARDAEKSGRYATVAFAHLSLGRLETLRGRRDRTARWLGLAERRFAESSDRGGIVCVMATRARLAPGRSGGDPEAELARCLRMVEGSGAEKLRCELLCELAAARHERGRDPRDAAAAAAASFARLDVGPRSTTARGMSALRRRLAGRPAVAGSACRVELALM